MKADCMDLEVFVLTYNRADFLEQTLISLCKQTCKGFGIIVLDNASTDNTVSVVESFKEYGVKLCTSEKNLGPTGNLERAKSMASRQWVMVFHDDDLLHPKYIETAMNSINRYSSVVLAGAGMTFENNPDNLYWPKLKGKTIFCKQNSDFAAILYRGFPFHYGSAIYRTEIFKKTSVQDQTYGKIADRPLLLDVARHGSMIVFKEPYVKYRCHAGQDSATGNSGPFVPELIALHKKYLQLLGSNPFTSRGRAFIRNNYRYLCNEFESLKKREKLTKDQYIKRALQDNASTKLAIWYGRLVTGVYIK